MKILIACEESQAVTKEFRAIGHYAYSCDLYSCSGGHPEWHIKGDVSKVLNDVWDMIVSFPPCTYLTCAGNRSFSLRMNSNEKVEARIRERERAVDFFMMFANHTCPKVAIENPVGYMNTFYRKPDQIIHPYYFGDNAQKRTCLWLKGLPTLLHVDPATLKKPEPLYICAGEKCKGKRINWCEGKRGIKGGQEERSKARSKTFPSIAKAMAEQWGKI